MVRSFVLGLHSWKPSFQVQPALLPSLNCLAHHVLLAIPRMRSCIRRTQKAPSGPRSAPTTKSCFLLVKKLWKVGNVAAMKLLPWALPTKTFRMSSCDCKRPSPAPTRNWKRTITVASFAASFPRSAAAISPSLPHQPWRKSHLREFARLRPQALYMSLGSLGKNLLDSQAFSGKSRRNV